MNEIVFVFMLILKEMYELLALKRQQILLLPVRVMLGTMSILLLTLLLGGILGDWPMFVQIILTISLICDIIVICSSKILRNLGGSQQ